MIHGDTDTPERNLGAPRAASSQAQWSHDVPSSHHASAHRRTGFAWLVAGLIGGILVLHVLCAATGRMLYRDQHLGVALNYAQTSVDLLHPVVVGFNANGEATPTEFPVWEAITALSLRWLGTWLGWGNIVSWLVFASCVPPFLAIARTAIGERAAWWSTVALLLQPLIVVEAGRAGADGLALAASIWFLYGTIRMINSGTWRWWLLAATTAAFAVTQKPPFFMAAAIAGIGLLWQGPSRWSLKHWLQLLLVGLGAIGVLFTWTAHANHHLALAEFPLQDLRITRGSAALDWYFGPLELRSSLHAWAQAAFRASTGVFGSFALVAVAVAALATRAQSLARWWLGGCVAATLVFTHVVFVHWHYYLMFCPAAALLVGRSLARAEQWVSTPMRGGSGWAVLTFAGGLLLACVQGLYTGNFLPRDTYPAAMAQTIAAHTSPSDRLLIAGGNWGGEELILSNRRGLSLWNTQLLETPCTVNRLRELGFTKLVVLSNSPRRSAVAVLGGSQDHRREWPELMSPTPRTWPVIFESTDLCIREVPCSGQAAPLL